MEEAEFLADHIAVIFKGKIIAEGTLEDLIRNYGKSSVLHIKKCKNSVDVIKMLKQEGYEEVFSEGNGDIAIKIDYKERVLEILSHLRHDCIEYESLDIRRSNLEEVFLRLTGAKLMEDTQ
jgi:ABC-2 type transport system ATP-binding protein